MLLMDKKKAVPIAEGVLPLTRSEVDQPVACPTDVAIPIIVRYRGCCAIGIPFTGCYLGNPLDP